MNWALLLITEDISLLDLWKYANSMLICTSNYVPFNVRQSGTFAPYLTGKFIQCGASKMSQASVERQQCVKMACYAGQCLLTSMTDCFRCSFLSWDGGLKREIQLKCVENVWSLFPLNKRRRNMNCSTRCLWKWHASCRVQKVHIISEPPQCQLFRNQIKRLLFLAWRLVLSKGIRKRLTGWQAGFSGQKKTRNETLHLSEVSMKISKSWWFLLNIWWMKQIF